MTSIPSFYFEARTEPEMVEKKDLDTPLARLRASTNGRVIPEPEAHPEQPPASCRVRAKELNRLSTASFVELEIQGRKRWSGPCFQPGNAVPTLRSIASVAETGAGVQRVVYVAAIERRQALADSDTAAEPATGLVQRIA